MGLKISQNIDPRKTPRNFFRVLNLGVYSMKKVSFVMKVEEYQELCELKDRLATSSGFNLTLSELVRSILLKAARKPGRAGSDRFAIFPT